MITDKRLAELIEREKAAHAKNQRFMSVELAQWFIDSADALMELQRRRIDDTAKVAKL